MMPTVGRMPPPDDSTARVPIGPVGGYVIQNLTEIRAARRLTYKQLADRLEQLGRPIPTLGLSRIEKGNRRVDADDLVALAVALGVSPSALLLPRSGGPEDEIDLTSTTQVAAGVAWKWADGRIPLPRLGEITSAEQADFEKYARPPWDVSSYGPQAPISRQIRSRQLDDVRQQLAELQEEVDLMRAAGEQQPVVAAIVTSPLGVLVGRRNDGKPPWTFIAGEVEPGERPEDAAVREVKEETGCLVRAGVVIGQRVHPKTGRTMIYMAAAPTHGTDVFVGDADELAEVRWVSLAEADELMQPYGMFEPVRDYLAHELEGA